MVKTGGFKQLIQEFWMITEPTPALLRSAFIGACAMLVGQITMLVHHNKHYALYCCEKQMAQRRKAAKEAQRSLMIRTAAERERIETQHLAEAKQLSVMWNWRCFARDLLVKQQ